MPLLQRVYYANILIALSASALLLQSHFFLKLPGDPLWLALWIFAATFSYYGLHDWYTKVVHQPLDDFLPRALFWRRHLPILLAFVAGFLVVALVSFAFAFTSYRLAVVAVFSTVAMVYTFPILPFRSLHRLKEHAYIKLSALCTAWAGITTFGALQAAAQITVEAIWLFAVRFLFMLLISLPFDLRDTQYDARWMTRTLAERLGMQRIIQLLWVVTGLLTATLFAGLGFTSISVTAAAACALHAFFCSWLSAKALCEPQNEKLFVWLDLQILVHAALLGLPWLLTYIRSFIS